MEDIALRRRQMNSEVAAARRARRIAAPFAVRFEVWNQRACKAAAVLNSHLTTDREKDIERTHLAHLRQEVEEAFVGFQQVIRDEPPHSRLDDIEAAFERLLSMLPNR